MSWLARQRLQAFAFFTGGLLLGVYAIIRGATQNEAGFLVLGVVWSAWVRSCSTEGSDYGDAASFLSSARPTRYGTTPPRAGRNPFVAPRDGDELDDRIQ